MKKSSLFIAIMLIAAALFLGNCNLTDNAAVTDTASGQIPGNLNPPPQFAIADILSGAAGSSVAPAEGTRLCVANPADGYWSVYYPSAPALAKVIYQQVCVDVILCPVGGTCSSPDGRDKIRVFGKCSPNPCDWGIQRLNYYDSFWKYAVYNFSFKTSNVWVHHYAAENVLLVVTQNYFNDGRPYYESYDYFFKTYNYGNVNVIK